MYNDVVRVAEFEGGEADGIQVGLFGGTRAVQFWMRLQGGQAAPGVAQGQLCTVQQPERATAPRAQHLRLVSALTQLPGPTVAGSGRAGCAPAPAQPPADSVRWARSAFRGEEWA